MLQKNRITLRTTGLVLAAVLLASAPGWSQQSQSESQAPTDQRATATTEPPLPLLAGFSQDYQVGPGDLLDIQIIGQANLRQSTRVSNSGEVSFQMLGQIQVANKTVFEIEDEIGRQLSAKGLIRDAEVLVSVSEFQAKPIYVSGAVENPGEFIMTHDLTVVDAILLAGGLRFNAGDEAVLHRHSTLQVAPGGGAPPDGPDTEMLRVDIRPLKEGKVLQTSPTLQRGDVIVVTEQLVYAFFVVGAVIDPRSFFYSPTKPLMASQAVSWAGGPTPTAKVSNGILVRYDEKGQRTELKMDYAAILKGEQPDIPIKPNDILFIPSSEIKSMSRGLVLLTDNMVMAASFRVARTYQLPDAPTPGQ